MQESTSILDLEILIGETSFNLNSAATIMSEALQSIWKIHTLAEKEKYARLDNGNLSLAHYSCISDLKSDYMMLEGVAFIMNALKDKLDSIVE